ncbi:MAG TPA: acyl-CoA synthetase [Ktedonobacterales bacterium]|nr:acyl-CoA synthetase [Ktedonobacterales bacterium]
MANSIVEAVAKQARRQPERAAIIFEGKTISYGSLYGEVERFARALVVSGLQRGDRVGMFLENSPAFVVSYLGAHLAGGVVTLINTQYRQVELSHILTDAAVRFCVTSPSGATELRSLVLPNLTLQIIVEQNKPVAEPVAERDASSVASVAYEAFLRRGDGPASDAVSLTIPASDAPAIIGYTSGTTGRAKGAMLLHRNLVANITAITTAWHWTPDDRLLLALPLFHTHGLAVGLHGTLFLGATAVLRRKFDAAETLAAFNDDPAISLFFGVPTMYGRIVAEAQEHGAPRHLPRLFVSGSAPLSPHLFLEFERIFGQRILERYGMTETGMNLTNPYDGERRAGTVGGPFPGQEARIVDTDGRFALPPAVIGEIEVRGPHVFAGYINRPDATAEAFSPDGWFKTGDLGWVSDDGYFTITGRARELIISGGYNIYPREIEDVLASHPAVGEAAVIGMADEDMGEQVVAVIVPAVGEPPTAEEIVSYCRERLASYKKPRQVIFVASLPRNALGKVQKHLLSAQLERGT